MSHFVTDLDVRRIEDGSSDGRGTWCLLAPFVYSSDLLGKLVVVPTGFVTDFASVPRIPVAFLLAGDCAQEGAVIHDFLYTSHEVDRATADAVLKEAALAGGSPYWRAWLMYLGVRIGGSGPYNSAGQRQDDYVQAHIDAVQA